MTTPLHAPGGLRARRPAVALVVVFTLFALPTQGQEANRPDPWANPTSYPQDLTPAAGYVYFTADDGVHGRELWRTDGTPEGTVLVHDLTPGLVGTIFSAFAACGDFLYFAAQAAFATAGDAVWRVGGQPPRVEEVLTETGDPVRVHTHQSTNPLIAMDERLFILAPVDGFNWVCVVETADHAALPLPLPALEYSNFGAGQLFSTKTTLYVGAAYNVAIAGTKAEQWLFRITAVPWTTEPAELGFDYNARILGTLGESLVFAGHAIGDAIGEEPYVWRPGEEAPRLIRDIAPGPSSGLGHDYGTCAIARGRLFVADDHTHGWEPWITDGTEEGTRLLVDIYPGRESSFAGMWTATSDRAFFQAQTRETGVELWVTDGTPEGTHLTRDIVPGPDSSRPYRPAIAGNRVFFSTHHPVHGEELWVSDGTEAGTRLVKDIVPGAGSSEPFLKAALGDSIVFTANDGIHGAEVWFSDGTEAGTFMLKDVAPARGPNPSSDPQHLTAVGNLVFFVVNDAKHGAELWRSDGTEAGTILLGDIYPGRASSNPSELAACGDYLFFQAEDPEHGVELWMSDGTAIGTHMFRDCLPGPVSSNPREILCINQEKLYFVAEHPDVGVELWAYTLDVSPSMNNPHVILDVRPGPDGSYPKALTLGQSSSGQRCLYFTADDGIHGRELFALIGERAYIVSDIITNVSAGSHPTSLTPSGNSVYFSATDDARGTELFRTDSEPESTRIVRDIRRPR